MIAGHYRYVTKEELKMLKKEERKKNSEYRRENAAKSVAGVTLVFATLASAVYLGLSVNTESRCEDLHKRIEKNIIFDGNYTNFVLRAICPIHTNEGYFVELFGNASQTRNSSHFTTETYKIDENLYKKILKYVDVEYNYNMETGIPKNYRLYRFKGVDYPLSEPLAAQSILKELQEITSKQEPVQTRVYNDLDLVL